MNAQKMAVCVDEARLDSLFERLDSCHEPGASVGISVNGIPVYRKGHGLASMDLRVPLTSRTRMRIYSVTKHFTSLAYLLLCEDGRAALDDPIAKYIPEIHAVARRATVRQLMSNTSGLWDISDIRWTLGGGTGVLPLSEVPRVYGELDGQNFKHGEKWCYNNGGFQLLSIAIQRIAGISLGEFFETRIFQPAGMYDTLLRPLDTDFVDNSAAMHMKSASGKYEKTYLPGELSGEGGIVSTVDDMLRWLAQMGRCAVGGPESWRALKNPMTLPDGVATGYGFGLFVRPYRGVEVIEHSGGGLGASSHMVKVPAADLDVVVLVNREDIKAPDLAYEVLNTCLPSVHGVESGHESGSTMEGVFRSEVSGHVLRLYEEREQQKLSVNGGGGYALQRVKAGLFAGDPTSSLYAYTLRILGDETKPWGVELESSGKAERFLRVHVPDKFDLTAVEGTYRSDVVDTRIRIVREADSARMETTGRFGMATYHLRCLGDNLWSFEPLSRFWPWRGIISLDSPQKALWWSTERTWSLKFYREHSLD